MSASEKEWLTTHPVVEIAVDNDFPPINFPGADGPQGMAIDLLGLLEQKTGLKFRYRTGSWRALIDAALAHEVDGIINADMTPERQQRLLFTDIYYSVPQAIVVRASESRITGLEDLENRTIALLRGTSHVDHFRREHPEIGILEADTNLARFDALVAGRADAIIGALPVINHIMQTNLLTGFKVVGLYKSIALDNLRIAVRNDAPHLKSILNKGIGAISNDEVLRINEKWLPQTVVQLIEAEEKAELDLTDEELAWLRDHPVIRVAADRSWPPVEYLGQSGEFEGISVDYLSRIGRWLGVHFEFDMESSWTEAVAKLKRRELDMFSAAMETPSRVEFASFTKPYLRLPQVVFARADSPFINSMDDMAGEDVAVVAGYAVGELIRTEFPEINLVEVDDIAAGLSAVRSRRVAAFIGGIMNVGYEIRRSGAADIKVAGQTPYELQIAMGVRSDWEVLRGILQKAIEAIPEREKINIQTAWAGLQVEVPPDYSRLLYAVALIAVGLLLLWGWQLSLQRRSLLRVQAETQAARQEAEEANLAKSKFLASMSHELRTPLNAVLGYAQLLKLEADQPLTSKQREYVESIETGGGHLVDLVNQVLDLARIEADNIDLDIKEFCLNDIVDECVTMVSTMGRATKVSIEDRFSGGYPLDVVADPVRTRQVLINLLTNAIKYNRAGGTVTIEGKAIDEGFVRLFVHDTGMGIDADESDKVFELFYTSQNDPMRASVGTGIGLSVSKVLMQRMGGRIGLISHLGEGSTFWIDLRSNTE